MTLTQKFLRNQSGVAVIEMAFILPLLLLFVFGAIEYGMFFLKANMNSNNVASAALAVQNEPGDPSHRQLLLQSSLLNNAGNVVCASSFQTIAEASAGNCAAGQWNTLAPPSLPDDQTAYFVLIKSDVDSKSLSGLFDEGGMFGALMPPNIARQIVKVYIGGGDHLCNGEPLESRRCYVMVETASEQYNIDLNTTYYSSDRRIISEIPSCGSAGWDCEYFANFASQIVDTGVVNIDTGYTQTRIETTIRRAGIIEYDNPPSNFQECSSGDGHTNRADGHICITR